MTTPLAGRTNDHWTDRSDRLNVCSTLVAGHTRTIELGPFCDMVSLVILDHVFSSDIADNGLW